MSSLPEPLQRIEDQVIACRLCPRLVEYREEVARVKRRAYRDEPYWGKPVPGFGDPAARILIVGLAPGAHGSNRTGRMFTGDDSGKFLYSALFRAGMANQPTGMDPKDGLELKEAFITAVGRCAPPDNKPLPAELLACRPYLLAELAALTNLQGVVALGKIAYDICTQILNQRGNTLPKVEFGHGALAQGQMDALWLLGSYHPSRQNTQTGKLTPAMFDSIWQKAHDLLK
ncbi:MAG: uracil-DNA glycosylase [Anaerolineaceae bacterium]|nr:uracil-DNA glycosylase [Anaerolineaceae bacterium]